MKHKNLKLLCFVSINFLLLAFGFKSVQAVENNKIDIKLEAGFDSVYKIGSKVPVSIEVNNSLREISGELQVEVEKGLEPGTADDVNKIIIYAEKVNLPNNSTKKFTLNVPINKYLSKLRVNITEGKKNVLSKDVVINGGINSDKLLIGVLSEDYDSLSYLSNTDIGFNGVYGNVYTSLTEKNFPDSPDVMNMFNIILVNNFDTSKLNSKQYNALKKWVDNGGMLIIGTGSNYNKTLSLFSSKKDDFISGDIGNTASVSTSALSNLIYSKDKDETLKINIVNLKLKNGRSVVSENGIDLVNQITKGKGAIIVSSFDFGLEPIISWPGKTEFFSKLVEKTVPEYYKDLNIKNGANIVNDPYMLTNSINTIPELPTPKPANLIIIFIIYILIVAPINYFVLKKLDKRELMWVSVPILSVIFAGVMFISGVSTRVSEPVINLLSYVNIDEAGNIDLNTYGGILTPVKSNIKVEGTDGEEISPLTNYQNADTNNQDNKKRAKVIDAKVTVSPEQSTEFYKNSVFSSRTVKISNRETLKGKFESNLNYSNNTFSGTIKNNSGFDMQEAYVLIPGNYISIGKIKNGETKSISQKTLSYSGLIYDFTAKAYKNLYGGPNSLNINKMTDKEIDQIKFDRQKADMINNYFQNGRMKANEPVLLGWSNTPVTKNILVDGKAVKKFEKELIIAPINLTLKNGNTVEYPFGYIKPSVLTKSTNGGIDDYSNTLYGNGSYEFQYSMDKNITIGKIEFSNIGTSQPSGNIKYSIWNCSKQSYEEKNLSNLVIKDGDLKLYLDKNNSMKVKIELADNKSSAAIPSISAKGSVK